MNDKSYINKIQNASPVSYKKFLAAIREYIKVLEMDKK
jgi:hypothetical protein